MTAPTFKLSSRAAHTGALPLVGAFRITLLLVAAVGIFSIATPCHAEEDTPSIFSYATSGFGTGLATGLAVGYLSTGPKYESDEWRKLLWGGGLGALSGLGVGLIFGVVDAGVTPEGRGVGFYVMRDSNLGFTLGALTGGLVGALYWAGGGTSKDVLIGLSWGTVIGAGTGMILGVVEGALRQGKSGKASSEHAGLHFDFGFIPTPDGVPVPYPNLSARF